MAIRYWYLSGGTANWNTSRWYTNAQLTGVPVSITTADDAIINQNSGPGTLNINTSTIIKSVNFSGYTGGFSTSTSGIILTINGGDGSANNYSLVGSPSISSSAQIRLNATSALSRKVIRNGMTINNAFSVNPTVTGATYDFDDYFETNSGVTFTLSTGRVNFNGDNGTYNATLGSFVSTTSSGRTVTCTGISKLNLIGGGSTTGTSVFVWNTSTTTGLTVSINSIYITGESLGRKLVRSANNFQLNDFYINCIAERVGFDTPPPNINNLYVTIPSGTGFIFSDGLIVRGNIDFTTSTGRWLYTAANLYLYGNLTLFSGLTFDPTTSTFGELNFIGNNDQYFYVNGNTTTFSSSSVITASKNNTKLIISGNTNIGVLNLSGATFKTDNVFSGRTINVYNGGYIDFTSNPNPLISTQIMSIYNRSDYFSCPNLNFVNLDILSGGKFLNLSDVYQNTGGVLEIFTSGITYLNSVNGTVDLRNLNITGGELYLTQSGTTTVTNTILKRETPLSVDPILTISNPLANYNCNAITISAGTFTHNCTVTPTSNTLIYNNGVLLNNGGLFRSDGKVSLFDNSSISGINSNDYQFIIDNFEFNGQSSGYFSGKISISGNSPTYIDITGTTVQVDGFINGSPRTLSLRSGTLISNGGATIGKFLTNNSTPNRTLTIASGTTWEITQSNGSDTAVWSIDNPSTFTLNATGSTIKLTNSSSAAIATFNGGNKTYDTFWINRTGSTSSNHILGNNTFRELKDGNEYSLSGQKLTNFTIPAHSLLFQDGSTQTVDIFNVNGIPTARIILNNIGNSGSTPQYTIQKSTSTQSEITKCFYLDIRRSQVIPVENIWYARGSIEGVSSSNSGWTITDERYWVSGGTKSWNSTSNWSVSSGGPSGSTVPSSTVSAIFDTNSGNEVVIITGTATCFDFDVSTFNGTISAYTTQNLTVYGDINLGNSITGFTNRLQAQPRNNDINVFSNGVQNNFLLDIYDNITPPVRHTVRLGDDYNSTNYIVHRHHNFDTNSKNITVPSFITGLFPSELYLNNSIITLTGPGNPQASLSVWDLSNEALIFDCGTSEIIITDTTNSQILFIGGGFPYNKVRFERGASTGSTLMYYNSLIRLTGNSFNEFIFNCTEPHTLQFTSDNGAGVTGVTVFNQFRTNGFSNSKRLTLDRNGSGQYIFKSTNPGRIKLNNVNVIRSYAEEENKFFANIKNSTISADTTNWSYYVDGKNLGLLGVG